MTCDLLITWLASSWMENLMPSSEEKEPMGERVPEVSTILRTESLKSENACNDTPPTNTDYNSYSYWHHSKWILKVLQKAQLFSPQQDWGTKSSGCAPEFWCECPVGDAGVLQKSPERRAGPAGWSTCSSAGEPHGNHLQTCTDVQTEKLSKTNRWMWNNWIRWYKSM